MKINKKKSIFWTKNQKETIDQNQYFLIKKKSIKKPRETIDCNQ